MASTTSTRVYVGGLPADIKTKELRERFGSFVDKAVDCQLTHVEIPKAKAPGDAMAQSTSCRGFAYLTLEGGDAATQSDALQKTYNRTKWRGSVLKVQVAKPHYKLKLEQEREERERERQERELKRRGQMMHMNTRADEVQPLKLTVAFKGRKKTKFPDVDEEVKVETDIATSESEDDMEEEEALGEDGIEAFVSRMEKEAAKMEEGKAKKVLSKEEMNARRLAALEAKQKRKKEEKVMIPAIGEAMGNTKITFDDSGNEQEPIEQEEEGAEVISNWMDSSGDDASEDEAESRVRKTFDFTDDGAENAAADVEAQAAFALRPEFVGEKGKKLFEMQKRFGGDTRFRLDARFLEQETNEFGGNDVEDDERKVDEEVVPELQSFLEEEDSDEAARYARELRQDEETALRVMSKLFPDVDVERLQRRMQEHRTPKDPLKEAAWMGELKRYDPRDVHACHEFEIPMTMASFGAEKDEKMSVAPKHEKKEIPTGGDRFFSTSGDLSNLFSRVRKNSEDGEEGEAALDGVFTAPETESDAPFKLSALFSFPVGEDKSLAVMGEQLLEDEHEEAAPSADDWTFSQDVHPIDDDHEDEAMATDSEAGDDDMEDEEQTKSVLTKERARKSLEDFLAFGRTFIGSEGVVDWPERRKKLTLDYKRKRRDAVKMKKRHSKQQSKANKTKTEVASTETATLSTWKKARL